MTVTNDFMIDFIILWLNTVTNDFMIDFIILWLNLLLHDCHQWFYDWLQDLIKIDRRKTFGA